MSPDKGQVTYEIHEGIAIITFGHPSHNSLPGGLLKNLQESILKASSAKEVKAILLQSEGERTFCAGANFDELRAVTNQKEGFAFFMSFARVINAIREAEKFVICRVQGKAVGGGVGLIAAADYTMSTKWGSVRLSELQLGIGPFVIGPAVERKLGRSAFMEMAINASEWQTAEWAREHGLYHELFDKIEQLDDYLERFLERIRNYSPAAMKHLKQVFWQGTENWDILLKERAQISGDLLLTPEAQQAINKLATT